MTTLPSRQAELATVLPKLQLPPHIQLRCWNDTDMPTIQRLVDQQGWPTHHAKEEVLGGWRHAWPTLVATHNERVVGYIQALTDEHITMHIADLLVDPEYRGQGIGRLLLEACHLLYPRVQINLIAEKEAIPFYKAVGYQPAGESFTFYTRFW